jgi:hypothetical protein
VGTFLAKLGGCALPVSLKEGQRLANKPRQATELFRQVEVYVQERLKQRNCPFLKARLLGPGEDGKRVTGQAQFTSCG